MKYQKYRVFREYPDLVDLTPFPHPAIRRALDVAQATATSWFGKQLLALVFPDSVSDEAAFTMLQESLQPPNFATIIIRSLRNNGLGGHYRLPQKNEIMISPEIVDSLIAAYDTGDAQLLDRHVFEASVVFLHWYRTRRAPGTWTPPSYKMQGRESAFGGGEFGWWGEYIVYGGWPTGFRSLQPPFLLDLVALAKGTVYHSIPDNEIKAFLANPRAVKVWSPAIGPPVKSFPGAKER